ncbi:hypothetical protein C8J56DRAFT_103085 [Mycena floridula]|nr:hypothetical protein C8J56DRAFT_103085 [Mycena floridula]
MSVGNVRQITVSNSGAYNANIRLVSGNGNTYPLTPKVEAGDKNIIFDLTKVQGPNNGDTVGSSLLSCRHMLTLWKVPSQSCLRCRGGVHRPDGVHIHQECHESGYLLRCRHLKCTDHQFPESLPPLEGDEEYLCCGNVQLGLRVGRNEK